MNDSVHAHGEQMRMKGIMNDKSFMHTVNR